MGQKVNPIGLRLGINRTWDSRWFSRKEYGNQLHDDIKLRGFLGKRLGQAAVSKILIERAARRTRITLHSARPGVIIGKKGADIDKLRADIAKITNSEVSLNIVEIRKPEIEAKLIAEGIAQQLERRVAFRRAMKRAVQSAMRFGAQGIRINCSGRLGGAEIARMEWYREGRVPLHTLRADVDFGYGTAKTTYGTCGVKVWVFKGEILAHDPMAQDKRLSEQQAGGPERPERRERGDRGERQLEAIAAVGDSMLSPKRTQIPQGPQGPHPRRRQGRHDPQFRGLWPEGGRTRAHHGAPDRGGAAHDHAHDAPQRPGLDPHLPGRAGLARNRPRCAWAAARGRRNSGSAGSSRAASCSSSTA